jgi:hypothetical protein
MHGVRADTEQSSVREQKPDPGSAWFQDEALTVECIRSRLRTHSHPVASKPGRPLVDGLNTKPCNPQSMLKKSFRWNCHQGR